MGQKMLVTVTVKAQIVVDKNSYPRESIEDYELANYQEWLLENIVDEKIEITPVGDDYNAREISSE